MCGLLQKPMYGTQDAPNIWQSHYSGILIEGGYKRGKSNASVFCHPQHDVRVMVHGDDFLAQVIRNISVSWKTCAAQVL